MATLTQWNRNARQEVIKGADYGLTYIHSAHPARAQPLGPQPTASSVEKYPGGGAKGDGGSAPSYATTGNASGRFSRIGKCTTALNAPTPTPIHHTNV